MGQKLNEYTRNANVNYKIGKWANLATMLPENLNTDLGYSSIGAGGEELLRSYGGERRGNF